MSSLKNIDTIIQQLLNYSIEVDRSKFELMPRQMYDGFLSYHRSLPPWSSSGAIDWSGMDFVRFNWSSEEFFPSNFVRGSAIGSFACVGIVYSMDFTDGYVYNSKISELPLDVIALCNGPAFLFGISDRLADYSSLLELRWPSVFTAIRSKL